MGFLIFAIFYALIVVMYVMVVLTVIALYLSFYVLVFVGTAAGMIFLALYRRIRKGISRQPQAHRNALDRALAATFIIDSSEERAA